MNRSKVVLVVLFLLVLPWTTAWAQGGRGNADLQAGLKSFKLQQYQEALRSFQAVIAGAGADVPEAYFWAARASMAVEQYSEAGRLLEYFLANYPGHPYAAEAEYQASRLPFILKDYEGAIQASQQFIRRYPKSEFVPNAWFWTAESLYQLGRLEEAARLYIKVVEEFPQSFKVEAARYRLSLLEFKKREDELMRLLKWSHEESLRAVAEFRQREQAYEQAIGVYQRRLAALGVEGGRVEEGVTGAARPSKTPEAPQTQEVPKTSGAPKAAESPETLETLKKLEAENASLRSRLQSLETQVDTGAAARMQELADLERALQIKAEALALKEALLLQYDKTEGKD